MRSLREIVLIAVLTAVSVCAGCKTKEQFIEPFTPVPIGSLDHDLSLEETIAAERQEELEEMIKEYKVPHVADIIYYHESNKSRFQAVMNREYGLSRRGSANIWNKIGASKKPFSALTLLPQSQMGKNKPSVIVVRSSLFRYSKKKEDLVSTIVDHEGMVHAKDNATGLRLNGELVLLKKLGEKLFASIMELRAYHNQLVQIAAGRDVSQECRTAVGIAYQALYQYVRIKALNGNRYARAAMREVIYMPVLDLDTRTFRIIKREDFFKGSGFEGHKCQEKHK
jgi:hypothetical protein